MKFVNLQSRHPMSKIEKDLLTRSNYYVDKDDERFTPWSLADYNKNEVGIHVSYNKEKQKITIYNEDGIEHKNFISPITEIFSGKLSEKNGVTHIKGIIRMSPLFNVMLIIVYLAMASLFAFMPSQISNIAVIAIIFIIYFIYVKKAYRDNMTQIAMFLGNLTSGSPKPKKNAPNKKKGKWAGKHY